MIDRCEPAIATWSMDGSNFVVKNVEKFASGVLPLYFKHSNFSSFARQLNFYGFRKLRTDPILTSDVDPRTACYVRFYHEKFQKDRPELLHQIKRATKSDQQSKDDVESLKAEVSRLKDALGHLKDDTDRRLAEMSYESNRRITTMGAEYDKLAALVHQLLPPNNSNGNTTTPTTNGSTTALPPSAPGLPPPSSSVAAGVQNALRHNPHAAAIAAAAAVAAGVPPPTIPPTTASAPQTNARMPDLMESLSQAAAISLQQQQAAAAAAKDNNDNNTNTNKRPAEGQAEGAPLAKQQSQQEMTHA
jgi:HSF-type DNA-binding